MSRLFDDGSTEYLEIDSAAVSGPPLTMAAWVYSDSITVTQAVMCVADKDTATDMHFLELAGAVASDPARMASILAGGPSYATTTSAYSANTWHHVAGVVAASNSRSVLIDGGNKGTDATEELPIGLDRTSIGRLGDSTPTQYFSGRIAEAVIWNVALTDAEIAVLAAGYSPLFVRPQNLVAYWPLIRDEDQDRVGSYDLTAFNTPAIANHPPIIYPAPPYIAHVSAAAPPATIVPIAMHHYRSMRI